MLMPVGADGLGIAEGVGAEALWYGIWNKMLMAADGRSAPAEIARAAELFRVWRRDQLLSGLRANGINHKTYECAYQKAKTNWIAELHKR